MTYDKTLDDSSLSHDYTPDPGPIPEELLSMPKRYPDTRDFVNDFTAILLASTRSGNRAHAFGCALAHISYLASLGYRDEGKLSPDLSIITCADKKYELDSTCRDAFSMLGKLQLAKSPWPLDTERNYPCANPRLYRTRFDSLLQDNPSPFIIVKNAERLFAKVEKWPFSAPGEMHSFIKRRRASAPHTLWAYAVTDDFFGRMSEKAIGRGLLADCIVLEPVIVDWENLPAPPEEDMVFLETPQLLAVTSGLMKEAEVERLDLSMYTGDPIAAEDRPEAAERRKAMFEDFESKRANASSAAEKAIWTGAEKNAAKLALLSAINTNPYHPLISDADVDWAWRFTDHAAKRFLYMFGKRVHKNNFEGLRDKAVEKLRKYGEGTLSHGKLMQYMHLSAAEMRRFTAALVKAGVVTERPLSRGGSEYTLNG